MRNLSFLLLTAVATQAFAQETTRPFVLTDGHNLRDAGQTLSALNAGVRIGQHLGALDSGANHLFQDRKEVSASELDTEKPHCELAVSNALKPNDIMIFNGTFSHIGITYHIDLNLLASGNASSSRVVENHNMELFITPNYIGRDFYEGAIDEQRNRSALMIPAESLVDFEDYYALNKPTPYIKVVCKKLSPCPTFGELKAILGDTLTFLPAGENVAHLSDYEIDQINGAQAACLQERQDEQKSREDRMQEYLRTSTARIMGLVASVQAGTSTIEDATKTFMTELVQAMSGETVNMDEEN